MKKRLLSMLLCLCMLISLIPAIPIFAAGGGPVCDHSYTAAVTPPTCAAKGYTTYTCIKCGYTYIGSEVDTLDHKFDKNGVCTVCGRKALTVRFACDEGASVVVYETQEFAGLHEDEAEAAYPRNAENGKIDFSGEGQVNFIVKLRTGYELESVTAAPASAYKNLKLPFETGVADGYRLNKISGDLTVTVKVKKKTALKAFTVTFECDPGVSVTTYEKQNRTGAFEENAVRAVARNGATGEPDISGSGQVNFLVVVSPGYSFDGITLNPVNVFETVRLPDNLGIANAFRITGITGNVTVKVSAIPIGPHECEHAYVSTVIPPTCTEPGYTAYTCSKCGDSYQADETAPTGHSFCDQGFCTACGMLAHKIQFICDPGVSVSVSRTQGVGARVDENVSISYPRSSDTGLIVMDGTGQVNFTVNVENGFKLESVTPEPEGHFKNARPPAQPLITNKYRLTEITGDITVTIKSSVIDPDTCTHAYREEVTPPSCTAEGYTTYICSICGDRYVGERKDKIAHSYVDGICAVCGEKRINVRIICGEGVSVTVYETQKTDGPHTDNAATVHPRNADTGLEDGSGEGQVNFAVKLAEGYQLDSVTAAPAGAYKNLMGPADTGARNSYRLTRINGDCTVTVKASKTGCDHSYAARITAPTCTEAGYTAYTCTKCGASYTANEKTALGHNYIAAVTAPTCTEKGNTTYTCSRCGDSYQSDEKSALGHDYVAAVTAPTCLQKGYTTYTCARCGYKRVSNETPATGHEYKTVVKVPTCTEKGYTIHTCIKCGYSYTENETPVAGHDYRASVTEPTCLGRGYTTYTCLICGDSYVADERPALGHDFKITVTEPTCTEEGYTTYACTRCRYGYAANETAALGHSYSAKVTAPTCTDKGYTTFTCTACGDRYVGSETAALGHSYSAVVTAPTCTDKGYTTFTCTVCGDRYVGNETAALGHDYKAEVTAPTCTEKGYTTFTCAACGDRYVGSETAALGHDYKAEVTAPTCTEKGCTTYTCARCDHRYVGSETAALGHDYKAEVTAPTCTDKGYTTFTCTVCGDRYVGSETAALGHDYEAVVTAPTCTEKGYTTFTCTRCGNSYTDRETAALDHDWGEGVVTKQPLDTVPGVRTYTCARCAEQKTEAIQPLSHNHKFVAEVVPPTCTAEGYTLHTCRCGDSYVNERVPALGHKSTAAVTAPTCTEKGCTTYTCSRCGEVYTGEETEALGHDYRAEVTAPTCTERGFTTYTCARCHDSYISDEVDALGHAYAAAVTAPTCTEKGCTVYTCPRCGDRYVGDEIAALGHDYAAEVTAPTCTEKGFTAYTCSRCGDKYVGGETAALGHDYEAVVTAPTCSESGYTTYSCSRCGDRYVGNEIAAPGHDYEAVVTAPTCTKNGCTTYTCAVCGDKYAGDETAALGHDWDGGVVTAQPTETEKGECVYTCTRCGEKRSESIPVVGHEHSYTAVVTAPTCTQAGYTTYTCTCGDSYRSGETAALGHDYRAVVTAPTCTRTGHTAYTCSRCGEGYTGDETAALGHDYQKAVTAPTCTEGGYTTYTCSRCGDKYIGDEAAAPGHDWDDGTVTIEPTDTEPGERVFTCARCGEKRTERIPERNHVHAYTSTVTVPTCTAEGSTTHTCTCGDSYVDAIVPALGHDYRSVVTAPTCMEAGFTTCTCSRCGDMYICDETAALGHDYRDGRCIRCQVKDPGDPSAVFYDDLFKAIEAADRIDLSKYSDESAEAFSRAFDTAKAAATADKQEDVDSAKDALEAAVLALEEKPPAATPFRFDDVQDDTQYFYEPVYWAVENEITNGASPTTFNPGAGCTRAQVVTFLWRAAGKPEPAGAEDPFADVNAGQYYYKAVLWAVENEITNGTGDGTFSPDATCTRGQIVTFLWRYFEKPEEAVAINPFEDVMEGQYYTQAILWAVKNEITNGSSSERFSPDSTCTRSQIVTFLYRAMPEETK